MAGRRRDRREAISVGHRVKGLAALRGRTLAVVACRVGRLIRKVRAFSRRRDLLGRAGKEVRMGLWGIWRDIVRSRWLSCSSNKAADEEAAVEEGGEGTISWSRKGQVRLSEGVRGYILLSMRRLCYDLKPVLQPICKRT